MKKFIFLACLPITLSISAVIGALQLIADAITAATKFFDDIMTRWTSYVYHEENKRAEAEARARLRRNMHKNGNPP